MFEIWLTAAISGIVGASIGYYFAALMAAEKVREVLGQ